MALRSVLATLLVLVLGCSGDDEPEPMPDDDEAPGFPNSGLPCIPGLERPCTCGFLPGTQLCLATGRELGPCRCEPSTGTSGSSETD